MRTTTMPPQPLDLAAVDALLAQAQPFAATALERDMARELARLRQRVEELERDGPQVEIGRSGLNDPIYAGMRDALALAREIASDEAHAADAARALAQEAESRARLWDALLNSDRITITGAADDADGQVHHLAVALWATHPDGSSNAQGRAALRRYAQAMLQRDSVGRNVLPLPERPR